MRIAVTVNLQFSLFSNGSAGTSIAIAEMLKNLGNDVYLLNTFNKQAWWDDCITLKEHWASKVVHLEDLKEKAGEPFDVLFEIGRTFFRTKEERMKHAKACIYVSRKSEVFHDIEASIFPFDSWHRSFEGLQEIWTLDLTSTKDDLKYLELLGRCPVRSVPFLWTPSIVELYRNETKAPEWLQVTNALGRDKPWKVHITETNLSSQSSSTLPLLILRELKRTSKIKNERWVIHNGDHVKRSEFFQKNVEAHCRIDDLSGDFIGRQRVIDWVVDPKSCILSHMRFQQVRPYLFDAMWAGIPLIHNSPYIRKFAGSGYDKLYYKDNEITEAVDCFTELEEQFQKNEGIFSIDIRNAVRKHILEKVSPFSTLTQAHWKKALESIVLTPLPLSSPEVKEVKEIKEVKEMKEVKEVKEVKEMSVFKILFTDMWDDFNPSHNMFILMVNEAAKHLKSEKPIRVEGLDMNTLKPTDAISLCIFGPFGDVWRQLPENLAKMHYTGENSQIVKAPGVVMNMGFQHADFVDQEYLRLPLWMLEIDWFGADLDAISNPRPIPIDRCTNVDPSDLASKNKFCAFVVTNPCNPVRNQSFHTLNQYKKVDSAGRLYNNIGDVLAAGRGGGGGELKKFNFLKDYKFCLAYENSSSQGYTTEKYLHAKAAGCIPIYWGDPKVERDFDPAGFIDARGITTPEELIEAVRKVDEDPKKWLKMFSVPALDEVRFDLVRRTLSECARRILRYVLNTEAGFELIPRFLGAKTDKEAAEMKAAREALSPSPSSSSPSLSTTLNPPVNEIRLLTTPTELKEIKGIHVASYATRRFLPSLHHWLVSITAQKKNSGSTMQLECDVWLGDDVDDRTRGELEKEYTWIKFNSLPSLTVEGFPDLWNPQHFAWKLWILNELNTRADVKDRLVLYLDSGVFMCRWPNEWMRIAQDEGVCFLNDPRETNRRWCHEDFCKELAVNNSEKEQQQIWAGALAFVAGHPLANKLFADSWTLGQKRSIIVGPKWSGIGADKKPFGHRHDQSILSVLSARMNVPRYPMDLIYCDISLRIASMQRKALYVHRGAFTVHKPFAPMIDDCYIVNLDRRKDRLDRFYENHPEMVGRVLRLSAYDGKNLQLTPAIARLFRPHDFKWKKPVMGCALSHLSIWYQLANEQDDINSYLILEDDVKFSPDWERRWAEASASIPEDWDVLYFGGILPPNRAGFEKIKERVNEHFSRVAPNSFYGQNPANRYFHWCNYSYILSKNGARKVLDVLKAKDGFWTSGDHMVCNPVNVLNHYFLDPLASGCYQDEDPRYQTSEFNNFNRLDNFDSDLWNNTDCFPENEATALSLVDRPLDIVQALKDGRLLINEVVVGEEKKEIAKKNLKKQVHFEDEDKMDVWESLRGSGSKRGAAFKIIETLEVPELISKKSALPKLIEALGTGTGLADIPKRETLLDLLKGWRVKMDSAPNDLKIYTNCIESLLEGFLKNAPLNVQPPSTAARRFVALKEQGLKAADMFERIWLEEIFGPTAPLSIEPVELSDTPPTDSPIVVLMRPWIEKTTVLLDSWSQKGAKFYVLHLSDEQMKDSLDAYRLPGCLGVVRNYHRADLGEFGDKVYVLPLGYHWSQKNGVEDCYEKTPRLPFREYTWSFAGTDWNGRKEQMKNLNLIEPNRVLWYNEWRDPKMLSKTEYMSVLLNSKFVPTPGGVNAETFRFYEALECGCVPLYVRQPNDDLLINGHYASKLQLLNIPSWDHAAGLMFQLSKDPNQLDQYRIGLLNGWKAWKVEIKQKVRQLFRL